jgi:hypothetical protein
MKGELAKKWLGKWTKLNPASGRGEVVKTKNPFAENRPIHDHFAGWPMQ